MKAQIPLKKLLKVFNPFKDSFLYKGKELSLNQKQLQSFVTQPQENHIWEPLGHTTRLKAKSGVLNVNASGTQEIIVEVASPIEELLYRNLALYIINQKNIKAAALSSPIQGEKEFYISLDLDKKYPIEAGLFELVKAIYQKEENIFVSIAQAGDNALFLKTLPQLPIDNKVKLAQLIPAVDKEYFIDSGASQKDISGHQNIGIQSGHFLWQADKIDLYERPDWILSKIEGFLDMNKRGYLDIDSLFSRTGELLAKCDKNIINSTEFKEKLLNLMPKAFPVWFFSQAAQDAGLDMFLDTATTERLLTNCVKGQNDFSFLCHTLFAVGRATKESNKQKALSGDQLQSLEIKRTMLEKLLNSDEGVVWFDKGAGKRGDFNDSFLNSKTFISLSSAEKVEFFWTIYSLLSLENKTGTAILVKMAAHATVSDYGESQVINLKKLALFPEKAFKVEEFIAVLIKSASADHVRHLLNFIETKQIECPALQDKNFFLKYNKEWSRDTFPILLKQFKNFDSFGAEDLVGLVEQRPSLIGPLTQRAVQLKGISSVEQKITLDLCMQAKAGGVDYRTIDLEYMRDYLLLNGTPEQEHFKRLYVVSLRLQASTSIYSSGKDRKEFLKKYNTLENMYIAHNTELCAPPNALRKRELQQIKEPEKVLQLLHKISQIQEEATIAYTTFYHELADNLRKDVDFLERSGLLQYVPYADLEPVVKCDEKIALIYCAQGAANAIAPQFFYQKEFALQYAKLLDEGNVLLSQSPVFIQRFFENQGVEKHFYNYLNAHINRDSLTASLSRAVKDEEGTLENAPKAIKSRKI